MVLFDSYATLFVNIMVATATTVLPHQSGQMPDPYIVCIVFIDFKREKDLFIKQIIDKNGYYLNFVNKVLYFQYI